MKVERVPIPQPDSRKSPTGVKPPFVEADASNRFGQSATAQTTMAGTGEIAQPLHGVKRKEKITKPPKPPMSLGRKIALGAAGAAVLAIAAAGVGRAIEVSKILRGGDSGQTETVSEEASTPRLPSANWQQIPKGEIKNYSTAPQVTSVPKDQYPTSLPSIVKERAEQAGYVVAYLGDPNDTTGRTVVARYRHTDPKIMFNADTYENEFGESQLEVKGMFSGWVINNLDPEQKDSIYMLLKDPSSGKSFLVNISLKQFNPNDLGQATYFIVDNLTRGFKEGVELTKKYNEQNTSGSKRDVYTYSMPEYLPENLDEPNAYNKGRSIEDFPAIGNLLEERGLFLDDLLSPGDYVVVVKQVSSKTGASKEKNGVVTAQGIKVGRYGSLSDWEQEVGLKTSSATTLPDGSVNYGNGVIGPTPEDVQRANSGK